MFIHVKSVLQHYTTLIVEEDLPLKAKNINGAAYVVCWNNEKSSVKNTNTII